VNLHRRTVQKSRELASRIIPDARPGFRSWFQVLDAEGKCKIDDRMRDPTFSADEKGRVDALHRYSILDTSPEQIYDDVTALASLICGTPISLVSLVDADRQWFKAAVGLEIRETPRAQSFCAHTLGTATTLIVADAQKDPRFMNNPAVAGDPGIRFYAGAPIVEPGGHVLGTVCVIDTTPRSISPIQIAALEALARHVMALMEMRRTIEEISRPAGPTPDPGPS
jgi:two-component system, NtrC family, sensor kinase